MQNVKTILQEQANAEPVFTLSLADYEDRVHAAWLGQMMGVLLTLPYEHQISSVLPITRFPKAYNSIEVDDDWYYEMVAVRAFEAKGIGLTVDQLGEFWLQHNCGAAGSSREAAMALRRGVPGSRSGHPTENRLWWTIGPMFSCELYGLLCPGQPQLAAQWADRLGRINGHGEGLDGGVFTAALVSLAFRERDSQTLVRQAVQVLPEDSPYRQAVQLVIDRASAGADFHTVCEAVEDRWHIEYPATNNAVANGGLLAACVWFAKGDFEQAINLAASAGDYVDTDNFAATAAAVVGASYGTKALPAALVAPLQDRIVGEKIGNLPLTPPVDETVSELAKRTTRIGTQILFAHGTQLAAEHLQIPVTAIHAIHRPRFQLADLMQYWNPEWTLQRAGFGGGNGGMPGIRGMTYLEADVLATYPRDEVRGLVLRRSLIPAPAMKLMLQVGVDPGRCWNLKIYLNNRRVLDQNIIALPGAKERYWQPITVDLSEFAGQELHIRLFQRVLVDQKTAGNAYWRQLQIR